MAIVCDAQTLAGLTPCLVETFSRVELKAIRIRLLCAFLNGESMNCDPQSLATASACILENMSAGDMEAAETYLVCQINSSGGGGGGGTGATFGNYGGVAPNFTPASGVGLAVDISNQTLWEYNTGAWHNLV